MKRVFLYIPVCIFFAACKPTETVVTSDAEPLGQIASDRDEEVKAASEEILTLFAERSFNELAKRVHPVKGVRFSPYSYIDTAADVQLSAEALLRLADSREKINWGSYDGSGEPIELNVYEYINSFVYTADFLHAERTGVNQSIGVGNTIDNIGEIYAGDLYTESWFSGFDPSLHGMDWCSLRLVYEYYGEQRYLVAVIHSQWTI